MFFNGFGQFNFNAFNGFNNFFAPFNFNMPQVFNFQLPAFSMPVFNYSSALQNQSCFNNSWNNSIFQPVNSFNTNYFNTTNTPQSPLENYNSAKGNLLTNIALNRTVGEIGYCAKFVQEAMSLAGLGSCTGANAYQMADTLRYNPNFQEIPSKGTNVNTLPAGCILVYDKYVRDKSEDFGHTEITTGDGGSVADGLSNYINPNPSSIFVPV